MGRGLSPLQESLLVYLWERTQVLHRLMPRERYRGVSWHTQGTRSAQASISRALKRLEQRGLVLRINVATGQPGGLVRRQREQPHTRTDHVRLLDAGIEIAQRLTNGNKIMVPVREIDSSHDW